MTGKMFCLPFAKDLSTEERLLSAVGFGFGSFSKAWGAVKNTGVNPGAKAVAHKVLSLGDEFAEALQASRRTTYKTLRGAITTLPVNDFEKKAGLYLMKDLERRMLGVGDDGVRKVLDIPKNAVGDAAKAPDFLSVSKSGGLVLSEAKGILAKEGAVDVLTAIKQLKNAMKKLKEKNLVGDVERVEIIKPWGAKLKDGFKVKDGYLQNAVGEPVLVDEIEGITNVFIRVLEL
ncbi:MAG: hypothetical protein HUU21_22290 [Polyangiaceae bacterium]|nr:hypothetical protein [Polyangiaceae bacterium]